MNQTLKKLVTLGKMGSTWKIGSHVEKPVREIAQTFYIRSCDMIGRGKTKTNHNGREGLKRMRRAANAAFWQ